MLLQYLMYRNATNKGLLGFTWDDIRKLSSTYFIGAYRPLTFQNRQ